MADQNTLNDALNELSGNTETDPAQETDTTETETQEETTETEPEETETEQASTEDDSASGEESEKEESESTQDSESSEDETGDDEKPQKKDPENTKPMRQLRNQYRDTKNKLDEQTKVLEKLAKAQGMSTEEFVQKLEDQTDEELAKKNNISPEIQKKLRQQEERLNEVEEERRRSQFVNRVNTLKQTQGLKDDQIEDFVRKSYENGFDIMDANVNMEAVYNAVYHEDQIAKIREEERQRVYQEMERQRKKSPTQTKRSGTGQEGKIKDMDEAMKSLDI